MQIDQEPREYRAAAIKGEPVFQPGAGQRVFIWAMVFVFLIGLSVVVQFLFGGVASAFGAWLANAIFPS